MADLEQGIKQAFSKVKEDIQSLQSQVKLIEEEHRKNKEEIEKIVSKINEIYKLLKEEKGMSEEGSIGNEGVNHLINQSITNQSFNQSINHSNPQNDQNLNPNIKEVTQKLDNIFFKLSKQELKLFLMIYQLEDEGLYPNYKNLSIKMQLSEHCIRSHISSLFKKNAPIIKTKLGNHTTLLSLNKDFKALNMKTRLITLYYDSDPYQKTLFDI